MGATVDGGDLHSVITACAVFGAIFALLSALSVTLLVAVNWRPWRIYRYSLVLPKIFSNSPIIPHHVHPSFLCVPPLGVAFFKVRLWCHRVRCSVRALQSCSFREDS